MIEYSSLTENELLSLLELYQQLNAEDTNNEIIAKNIWSTLKIITLSIF